jgi:D-alanyl-lipoteichoic acid acyltransferase DltB (MBOAT superfamily)
VGRPGPALVLATVCFAFQIYADFSGYSDIAIGASRVLGIDLARNFDTPYLSTSVSEFWRRWHISLSSWFRDYVYVPLGGNRVGRLRHAANVLVTFLLSGLWHGASWTFVVWGALHGLFVIVEQAVAPLASAGFPTLRRIGGRCLTFTLVCVAWIFFRARNLDDAWYILTHLMAGLPAIMQAAHPSEAFAHSFAGLSQTPLTLALSALAVVSMLAAERIVDGRDLGASLQDLTPGPRWALCYATLLAILLLGRFEESQFIYFQF